MITAKAQIKVNRSKDLYNSIQKGVSKGMEGALKHGKEVALQNKRGSRDNDSILYEIIIGDSSIEGRVYTNFDYALFLEFGTGTKSELDHIGHTETFKKSGYRYWLLPKEVADAKGKEFAPERVININGNLFYLMFATQPYPFMRPTAFDMENNTLKIFADAIRKEIV